MFLPLIALSIVLGLGITLGFILVIVPGIILILMWSVAVPSLVIERTGILGAFNRSAELTQGAKWKIFALFAIVLAIQLVLGSLTTLIGAYGVRSGQSPEAYRLTTMTANIVFATIINTLWGTIQPSLYVELKQWKEGDSVESLEQIFA